MKFNLKNTFSKIKSSITSILPKRYIVMQASNYGRGGAKFPGGLNRSTPIDIHNHFQIRQQVREKMYDSIDLRSLVRSRTDTIVDTGRKLKPTPMASILKLSPEYLEEWSENVSESFHLWAKSKKSHRSRVNNFYQNEWFYELCRERDNDLFVRFYYGRDKDLINPLQIEFVEPNQIRGTGYTSTFAQNFTDDGIERDDYGREKRYKIWYYKNGEYKDETIPAVGEKSGRIFMIHGFRPEYAGQGRGLSDYAAAIQELSNFTDFKLSVIMKAINQSSFVAAIENEQQDASNPLEGRVAGPIREYGSNPEPSESAQNVTAESLEPVINWQAMPEATNHVPGSTLIANMQRGDKIKYLSDTSPSQSYDNFVASFFSSICAMTGWSMEVVLKKFSNNYSASRGTLILCWRVAQIEGSEMVSDFLDPVYEMWLSEEIAAGRISAPGWTDPRLRDAWLCCEWSGAPMPNIDPLKTAEADQKYVELGAQTLDDVARNLNGSSGRANRVKNARQYEELPTPPWPRAPISLIPNQGEE